MGPKRTETADSKDPQNTEPCLSGGILLPVHLGCQELFGLLLSVTTMEKTSGANLAPRNLQCQAARRYTLLSPILLIRRTLFTWMARCVGPVTLF
jgi:hypothetical protein